MHVEIKIEEGSKHINIKKKIKEIDLESD